MGRWVGDTGAPADRQGGRPNKVLGFRVQGGSTLQGFVFQGLGLWTSTSTAIVAEAKAATTATCLLYTSPSPRD
eukprot:3173974-Alexandrium_andersonii.AAC.1